MKLPRWLTVVMLSTSAVAVVAAAIVWWISWPAQTVREFTTLLEQGRFEEANHFLKPPSRLRIEVTDTGEKVNVERERITGTRMPTLFSPESWQGWCTLDNLEIESRSITAILRGRQEFSFHRQFTTPVFIGGYAERGCIVLSYENWAVQP